MINITVSVLHIHLAYFRQGICVLTLPNIGMFTSIFFFLFFNIFSLIFVCLVFWSSYFYLVFGRK